MNLWAVCCFVDAALTCILFRLPVVLRGSVWASSGIDFGAGFGALRAMAAQKKTRRPKRLWRTTGRSK